MSWWCGSNHDVSRGWLSALEGAYIPIATQSPVNLLMLSCQHDLKITTPSWTSVTLNGGWHLLITDRVEDHSQRWKTVSHVSPKCFVWTPLREGRFTSMQGKWYIMAATYACVHLSPHVLDGTFISSPLVSNVSRGENTFFLVHTHLWINSPLADLGARQDGRLLKGFFR